MKYFSEIIMNLNNAILHNTMEDIVLFCLEDVLKEKNDICKCDQCRLDMACYILNKVQPRYVLSSRGIVHYEKNKIKDNQEYIDIYTLAMEAIQVVSQTMRHNKKDINKDKAGNKIQNTSPDKNGSYYYNFPQIVGRVIDSDNLEPICDAKVTLHNGDTNDKIAMFNVNWQNPALINDQMDGFFSFWPVSIPTDDKNKKTAFVMFVTLEKEGYETMCKSFEIESESTPNLDETINKEQVFRLNEIYLSPASKNS